MALLYILDVFGFLDNLFFLLSVHASLKLHARKKKFVGELGVVGDISFIYMGTQNARWRRILIHALELVTALQSFPMFV